MLRRREREAHAAGSSAIETIGAAVGELRESGVVRGGGAGAPRPAADHAGLHRAPDRGQAADDPHQARPHRRRAARARPRVPDAGGGARGPRGAARGARLPVADGGDAGLQAGRDGRGAQRPLLLRVRPLRPRARGGGLARAGGRPRSYPGAARPPRLPALRQLDRRRPRRQPVRDGGGDRGDAARAPRARAAAAAAGDRAAPRPPQHHRAARCRRGARREPAAETPRSSRRRRSGPRSATAGSPTDRSCCTSTASWGRHWRRAAGPGGPTTASAPAPTPARPSCWRTSPPAAKPGRARRAAAGRRPAGDPRAAGRDLRLPPGEPRPAAAQRAAHERDRGGARPLRGHVGVRRGERGRARAPPDRARSWPAGPSRRTGSTSAPGRTRPSTSSASSAAPTSGSAPPRSRATW